MKKIFTLAILLAGSVFLIACDSDDDQTVASSQTQTSQSSSTTVASTVEVTTELDGTYVFKGVEETKTLTIQNGTGTMDTLDVDGETETEAVTVDGANKVLIVGDDRKSYNLEGSNLTLTETDGEVKVFTKQ
ncbi:hypothetical protein [Streptococcus oriscaviae]|uniref:Lipoprotein n=1 Tax=Streptococcus oriscaviae TaxID=2781599 RepID=A0ABX7YIR1_9STRE|nr:hypothetical protein [Streptococcus oriscaviae]QUE53585.1 hypothetical protein INT76_06895 [Streptococcus oriscaviae]